MLSKKLLGTLVVIAAAVVVPASAAARGSDPAVRSFSMDETGILAATTLADDGATSGATASAATSKHRLVVKDAVTVGTDGNGVSTASFGGVARSGVRYVLVVENGCREAAGTEPCPSPVTTLSVTLNDQVVFQATTAFEDHRARLPANAVSASQDNRLTVTAAGAPRSAARVRILAMPAPTHRPRRANTRESVRDAGDRNAVVGAAPEARTVFLALQETTQMENRRR